MAKHNRVWNESQYRRYLAEGRGQGTMENYCELPFILRLKIPALFNFHKAGIFLSHVSVRV